MQTPVKNYKKNNSFSEKNIKDIGVEAIAIKLFINDKKYEVPIPDRNKMITISNSAKERFLLACDLLLKITKELVDCKKIIFDVIKNQGVDAFFLDKKNKKIIKKGKLGEEKLKQIKKRIDFFSNVITHENNTKPYQPIIIDQINEIIHSNNAYYHFFKALSNPLIKAANLDIEFINQIIKGLRDKQMYEIKELFQYAGFKLENTFDISKTIEKMMHAEFFAKSVLLNFFEKYDKIGEAQQVVIKLHGNRYICNSCTHIFDRFFKELSNQYPNVRFKLKYTYDVKYDKNNRSERAQIKSKLTNNKKYNFGVFTRKRNTPHNDINIPSKQININMLVTNLKGIEKNSQ